MEKAKYFRIVRQTSRNGDIIYMVQSTDTKIEVFFGIWDDYTKENWRLDDAINQIKTIYKFGLKAKKIVYKTNHKILEKNKK